MTCCSDGCVRQEDHVRLVAVMGVYSDGCVPQEDHV